MLNRSRAREVLYRFNKDLGHCKKCGNSGALVREEKPLYIIECRECPYSVSAATRPGVIRLWEMRHGRKGGGWNRLYKFECCKTECEIRCNGPDPRRRLRNQQVIIQCRICQRAEMATHLGAVSSFSTLNANRSSS